MVKQAAAAEEALLSASAKALRFVVQVDGSELGLGVLSTTVGSSSVRYAKGRQERKPRSTFPYHLKNSNSYHGHYFDRSSGVRDSVRHLIS
ncbi:unnamed protein product [Boreogadus saida]